VPARGITHIPCYPRGTAALSRCLSRGRQGRPAPVSRPRRRTQPIESGWLVGPRGRARGRRRRFGCSLAPASGPPGTDGRSIHRCSSICWSELVQLAVHAQAADGCAEASVSVVSQARSSSVRAAIDHMHLYVRHVATH
jgi:hypothetical protein